jgi:glycosyltransferase involved in cell wall biosynthesis
VVVLKTVAVIPAYNEEFTVGSIVALTRRYVDEVVVVNDGSKDNTAWVAEKAGAVVVSNRSNRGKGFALKQGFERAVSDGGEVIITLDADGEHHPKDIPKLIKPVLDGECDVTVGVRYSDGRKKTPIYRRFGQKVLDAETNIIAKSQFTDTQSGFRCFTRKALLDVIPDSTGFETESFMLIHAIDKNLRVKEVSIEENYRKNTPVMGPVSHGIRVLVSLIHLVGRKHILLCFGVGSIISFTISVFLALRVLDLFEQRAQWPYGTIILSTMFFLVGIYMSTTGLMLFMINELKDSEPKTRNHKKIVELKAK